MNAERADRLSAEDRVLAVAFIASHHAVTMHTPFADVVVGCACTPGVQRDSSQWADHLIADLLDPPMTSGASTPRGASEDDRPEPVEEAGSGRVIPFPTT